MLSLVLALMLASLVKTRLLGMDSQFSGCHFNVTKHERLETQLTELPCPPKMLQNDKFMEGLVAKLETKTSAGYAFTVLFIFSEQIKILMFYQVTVLKERIV